MYKLSQAIIESELDNQIQGVMRSMLNRAKNKGNFGGYMTSKNKIRPSVTEDDIANELWPTVGGKPPQNFKLLIKQRLMAMKAKGIINSTPTI